MQYLLSDATGAVKIKQIPLSRDNLISDDVCLVDGGDQVFIWAGRGSSENEISQVRRCSFISLQGLALTLLPFRESSTGSTTVV